MIGPLGRLGAAATLGQHCPQMTQRRCIAIESVVSDKKNIFSSSVTEGKYPKLSMGTSSF